MTETVLQPGTPPPEAAWGGSGALAPCTGNTGSEADYDRGMDEYLTAVIWAILPTVVVLGLLIFILRSILRMDRNERKAYAKVEAEERRRRGLAPRDETAG